MKFFLKKLIYNEYLSNDILYKKYLGFISVEVFYQKNCIRYKIFGRTFFNIIFTSGKSQIEILRGILKFKFIFAKKMLLPNLNKFLLLCGYNKNENFFCFFNHTGETHLQLYYLKEYLEKNNFSDCVFCTIRPYLVSIIKNFFNKNVVVLPRLFFELCYFGNTYNLKNYHLHTILFHKHFVELESKLQNNENIHFWDAIKDRMNVKPDTVINTYCLKKDVETFVNAKIKLLGINIDNFIYISPLAQSNESMPIDFWRRLSIFIKEVLNIHVLINIQETNLLNEFYGKSTFFSFSEAIFLSKKAKAIVGIRSGFMDLISDCNKPIYCIYKPFRNRSTELPTLEAEKVLTGFTLKKLPNVNSSKIYEYCSTKDNDNKIFEEITNSLIKNLSNSYSYNQTSEKKL